MSVKYPETNNEIAELYFNAMHEVRVRLRAIEEFLKAPLVELIMAETCHLQLRMCCECLSVACLAAQGDFETNRAFRDEYSPISIFKALEKTYPTFFPTPSSMLKTGAGSWHFDDVGYGNAISRQEIEDIWKKSGDQLHRTSAKKYLKRTNQVDLEIVVSAKERFWGLLMGHIIVLSNRTARMHVRMDRDTDKMDCTFLHLDVENLTSTIETYILTTSPPTTLPAAHHS